MAGKPLIAWTIEAALDSRCLERLVVSTDDTEIADVARASGAEVPFLRPAALSQDSTPGVDVVLHAVTWLAEHEHYHPEYVILLQPTSPLRSAEDIQHATDLATSTHADLVLSVTPTRHHPYWTMSITSEGRLVHFMTPGQTHPTRQSLPPAYVLNGAIYLVRCSALLEKRSLVMERTSPYLMPDERSLDIDTLWDFRLADLILQEAARHPT